jgi:serine/threonine protein kinase
MADVEDFPEDDEPRLAPGTRLGKYAIVRLLGAGGMGAVYEALHVEMGKHVAVKVLGPAVAAIPGARARFLREAQITSRVRHPNIVDVTDMGSEGGQTYLVMELLAGEDLAHRLARLGPMSERDLADIMLPVCAAVASAHHAGVTHRDLKPQNIFLAIHQNGVQTKVLDFGISKGSDLLGAGTLTGTGAMIGTPFYLAPEQILDNKSAGPASDQYALGVILYECLTGRRPFEAENLFVVFQSIVAGAPERPRARRPELSQGIEEVLLRAMHVNPRHRFESTHELGRALLSFASERTRMLWDEVFGAEQPDTRPFPATGTRAPSQPTAGAGSTPMPFGGSTPTPGRASTPFPPDKSPTTPLPPAAFSSAHDSGPWKSPGLPKTPASVSVSGTRFMLPSPPAASARPNPTSLDLDQPQAPRASVDLLDLRGRRSRKPLWVVGGILGCVGLAAAFLAWTTFSSKIAAGPESPGDPQTGGPGSGPAADPTQGPLAHKVPPPPESFRVSVTTEPDNATVELDGTVVGSGSVERKMLVDHVPHTLRISADGFEPRTVEFTDSPPPHLIALARAATPPPVPRAEPTEPTPQAEVPSPPPPSRRSRARSSRTASASDSPSARGSSARQRSRRAAGAVGGQVDDSQPALNPNGAPIID